MTTQAPSALSETERDENTALIRSILAAQNVPGPEPEDKVVHRGDALVPAPIVRTETKDAGHVWLRRNMDGKLVLVNRNSLAARIKQKLPDGRLAWLLPEAAHRGPFIGTEKCLLHPEHPLYRERYEPMGLNPCGSTAGQPPKGNFANREAVIVHMKGKHRPQWEMIEAAEERARQDARDLRDGKVAEALTTALGNRATQVAPVLEPASQTCPTCGKVFTAAKKFTAMGHLARHRKKEHPD